MFKIRNVSLLLLVSVLMTGCFGSKPKKPKYVLAQLKQKSVAVTIQPQARITKNNAFISTKNKKVFSEKGDAVKAYTLNGKGYFVVSAANGDYILMDESQKLIKTFPNASDAKFFESGDGEPIIAVKLNNHRTNYYDNIYLFDGERVNLINKNVLISSFDDETLGKYAITVHRNKSYKFVGYTILDVTTGDKLKIKVSKPDIMWGKILISEYKILGVAGDNFIYSYKDENSDAVIEAYNTKTQKKVIVARDSSLCQLLKYGNMKVLKIFENNKLHEESQMHVRNKNLKSKYTNEAARYIDLSTLEEVKYTNPELLQEVPIFTSFSNMGGGETS